MKALTVRQPWASLIAIGAKRIETRSWRTSFRGPIAIHAAKRRPALRWVTVSGDAPPETDLYAMGPCWEWIETPNQNHWAGVYEWVGPLGAIVATAQLVDCLPILPEADDYSDGRACIESYAGLLRQWGEDADSFEDVSDQLPYGDFTPGRWAWLLGDVQPTTERCPACWGEDPRIDYCQACDCAGRCAPIPAKGKQGVWRWTWRWTP